MPGSPLEASVPLATSAAMTAADINRTILAVWRIEQPRLLTSLSRLVRGVAVGADPGRGPDAGSAAGGDRALARHRHSRKARRVADGDRQAAGAGSAAPWPDAR